MPLRRFFAPAQSAPGSFSAISFATRFKKSSSGISPRFAGEIEAMASSRMLSDSPLFLRSSDTRFVSANARWASKARTDSKAVMISAVSAFMESSVSACPKSS